jgi:hypothetical protein
MGDAMKETRSIASLQGWTLDLGINLIIAMSSVETPIYRVSEKE